MTKTDILLKMIHECPLKDSSNKDVSICFKGKKPYCIQAITEGNCSNATIMEYYEEHEDEIIQNSN